jgi:hypothetical protein
MLIINNNKNVVSLFVRCVYVAFECANRGNHFKDFFVVDLLKVFDLYAVLDFIQTEKCRFDAVYVVEKFRQN